VGSDDGRQRLLVALEPEMIQVTPGEELAMEVRIVNRGLIVEGVAVAVAGVPAAWVSVEPAQVNLDKEGQAVVTVRFRPPRSPVATAGVWELRVAAYSVIDPRVGVECPGRLVIEPFRELSIGLEPNVQERRRRARYTLTVTNGGNQPVIVPVEGQGIDRELRVRPARPVVEVAPGRPVRVPVTVAAARWIFTGTPVSQRFSVAVQPADEPALEAGASLYQKPLLPSWALRAAVAVLLVAGGLGVAGKLAASQRQDARPASATGGPTTAAALTAKRGLGDGEAPTTADAPTTAAPTTVPPTTAGNPTTTTAASSTTTTATTDCTRDDLFPDPPRILAGSNALRQFVVVTNQSARSCTVPDLLASRAFDVNGEPVSNQTISKPGKRLRLAPAGRLTIEFVLPDTAALPANQCGTPVDAAFVDIGPVGADLLPRQRVQWRLCRAVEGKPSYQMNAAVAGTPPPARG
jgi:hypothetical protein